MKKNIKYWIESAQHDMEVAETLYENRKYDWCLFIAHLVLEKTLKAGYVKRKGKFPPKTHDLVRLAKLSDIEFGEETLDFLDTVNTFNISTRYPDENFRFYRICTSEFASNNLKRIKELHLCLKKQMDL